MNSYEENVRAILQCCFSQSKDELIETAVKAIVALKQDSITINPANPIVVPQPSVVPLPYTPITTSPAIIYNDTKASRDLTNGTK